MSKQTNKKNEKKPKRHATYTLTGRITDQNYKPLRGLLVRGFDQHLSNKRGENEFPQISVTDEDGKYSITFEEKDFVKNAQKRNGPDTYIRVYEGDKEIGSSINEVRRNVQKQVFSIDLKISHYTSEPNKSRHHSVQGKITFASGDATVDYIVRAYLREIGASDLRLGEALVNPDDDSYAIYFDPSKFRQSEKGIVTLSVAAVDLQGYVLATAARSYDAIPEKVEIDLSVEAPVDERSEFERYMVAVQNAIGDLQLSALYGNDFELDTVAEVTQIDRQHLNWLTLAAHYAKVPPKLSRGKKSQGKPRAKELPLHEVFYGWFRMAQSTELSALWTVAVDTLITTFKTAVEQDVIPDILDEPRLREWIIDNQLGNTLQLSVAAPPTRLSDLLSTIPKRDSLTAKQKASFALLYQQFGDTEQLWKAVDDSDFAGRAPRLRRTFALEGVTDSFQPLMTALQRRKVPANMSAARFVASVTPVEWLNLAFQHGTPLPDLSEVEYAQQLRHAVESRYPLAVFSEQLNQQKLPIPDFPVQQIAAFSEAHPDFEFTTHSVDEYADTHGIDVQTRAGLKKLERVLPLADSVEHATMLLRAGFGSAHEIAFTGMDAIKQRVGNLIDDETLSHIYANATAVTSMARGVAITLAPYYNNLLATVLVPPKVDDRFLQKYPTLRGLFGDLDYAACDHCASVLSPAAYLTDLLHFLATTPARFGGRALDGLLKYRPDIVELDLSCENTETEMPYIDLVLEVLENAVGLPIEIALDRQSGMAITAGLKAGTVHETIYEKLKRTAITINKPLVVETLPQPLILTSPRTSNWLIGDGSRRWRIRYQPSQLVAWQPKPDGTIPVFLPEYANLAAILADLDAGLLHPDLLDTLLHGQTLPVNSVPIITNVSQTPLGIPGWQVELLKDVVLTVEIEFGVPTTVIKVADTKTGQSISKPRQVPFSQGQYIAQAFSPLGSADDKRNALQMLGLSDFGYDVEVDNATGLLTLRGKAQAYLVAAPPAVMTVQSITYQNSSSRAQLKAIPENQNPAAYEKLRDAIFPWSLPLDLPLEEIRAYLKELGVPRRKLFELVRPSDLEKPAGVAEILGLSAKDYELLLTDSRWEAWGLTEKNNHIVDTYAEDMRHGTWLSVLQYVSMILQQAQLTYRELLELLQTGLDGSPPPITVPELESRPSKLTLTGLRAEHLDAIHRFVRLQRRSGWSIRELDRARRVFGPVLTEKTLLGLAFFRRLQERLQLTALETAGILGALETQPWIEYIEDNGSSAPSLYSLLFQNTALRSSEKSYADFTLNGDGTKLVAAVGTVLTQHVDFIAAALGSSATEITLIIGKSTASPLKDELTLENIIALYSVVRFCRAVNLSAEEYVRWCALFKLDPFATEAANRAKELLKFVDQLDFARAHRWSLEDLEYLLLHKVSDIYQKLETRLRTDMDALRTALSAVAPEIRSDSLASEIAALFDLQVNLSDYLVRTLKVTSQKTVRDVLLDEDFLDLGKPYDETSVQYQALIRLDKAARLLMGAKLTAAQVESLVGFGRFKLDKLPVSQSNTSLFAGWQAFQTLLDMPALVPGGMSTLDGLLAVGTFAERAAVLETVFGLAAGNVTAASKLLAIDDSKPAQLLIPRQLLRLIRVLDLAQKTGASVETLLGSLEKRPSPTSSAAIRRTFIAQFDSSALPKRLEPISNRLRETQRAALTSFLIARDHLRDENDVFDHYLMDVEMSACMITSRIKQAISSTQLFIQRCLLSLEPDLVAASDINVNRWRWMKNYRVWEANRKVFLYPENWIEPELRDDKSEIFENLESDLMQEDLTFSASVEAFRKYLEKAAHISRLVVLSMWEEEPILIGDKFQTIAHILARDESLPHQYFYRTAKLEERDAAPMRVSWTPWETIEGDIQSDHVQIFKLGAFVHIAYPTIKFDEQSKKWDVKMNVRRRTSEGWTLTAKQSKESIFVDVLPNKDELNSFVFRVRKLGAGTAANVEVRVYSGRALFDNVEPLFDGLVTEETGDKRPQLVSEVQFRTLEKYVDTLGRTFHRVIQCPIKAFAVFENFLFRSKDMTGIWRITNDFVSIMGGSANDRIRDFLVSAKTTTPDLHKPQRLSQAYQLLNVEAGSILYDFVFEVKPNQIPYDYAPNRDLTLDLRGSFTIGMDLALNLGDPVSDVIQPVLSNTEYYASVYRGKFDAQSVTLANDNVPILVKAKAPYFVVPSQDGIGAGGRLVAYSDPQINFFMIRDRNQRRLLPDGQSWIYAGLVTLPQEASDVSLDQLSTKVAGPVQIDVVRNSIDMSTSTLNRGVAFNRELPASSYDWEVFFHIPLLIATQLSKGQRFDEAQRWFHTIFDPTSNTSDETAKRFWKFKPFQEAGQGKSIEEVLTEFAQGGQRNLSDEIEEWRDHPFNPHLVARFRIRSYQWVVIIKYIENLIAWGDQLFRRDTIESINEATQLYILAARILGRRPTSAPSRSPRVKSYSQFETLDDFSNAWIELENILSVRKKIWDSVSIKSALGDYVPDVTIPPLGSLYFCVPWNDHLDKLWRDVADRLFNIRHCRNIEGIKRQLPLFEPPIDPALLVRATAAGLDISTVLAELNMPSFNYRFSIMLQKANEFCAEVKALGAAVLSALEKKDAEAMALLRSTHEIALLKLSMDVRAEQIEEAEKSLAVLTDGRKTAEERYKFYQQRLGAPQITVPQRDQIVTTQSVPTNLARSGLDAKESGLGISTTEHDQLYRLSEAQGLALAAGISSFVAGAAFTVGAVGAAFDFTSGIFKVSQSLGHGLNAVSTGLNAMASYTGAFATRSAIIGGYERRRDDWIFQSNLALREMQQIDKQIAAAEIRRAIAEKERDNLQKQVQNTEAVDEYMRSKYTNQELYRWMSGQLSSLYFRMYQLAHTLARRAEACLQTELGPDQQNLKFIQSGYWDSLRKGLLAGEQLQFDLKRMEAAYLEHNGRTLEMTKHISLRQLDPLQLFKLRELGECEFSVPEVLFDIDFPGHYYRRIKSVSVSIPAVTGPYTGVSGTLTLISAKMQQSGSVVEQVDRKAFGTKSIATSSAVNDSGMFELNFRDDRFLPFEGAGVESYWKFQLPEQYRAFDYSTISDLILHIHYTAYHSSALVESVQTNIEKNLNALKAQSGEQGLWTLLSLKQDFSTGWYGWLNASQPNATLDIRVGPKFFPAMLRGMTFTVESIDVRLLSKTDVQSDANHPITLKVDETSIELSNTQNNVRILQGAGAVMAREIHMQDVQWKIELEGISNRDDLRDIYLFIRYKVSGTK